MYAFLKGLEKKRFEKEELKKKMIKIKTENGRENLDLKRKKKVWNRRKFEKEVYLKRKEKLKSEIIRRFEGKKGKKEEDYNGGCGFICVISYL